MGLSELMGIPLEYVFLLTWRDVIEIIFFSTLFYGIITWLSHDLHHKLLLFFFASCACIVLSYALDLTTINSFLVLYMPSLSMLAILIHQRTLQKNFISLRARPAITGQASYAWIDDLIRVMLRAMSKNKPVSCIIERTDTLDDLVHAQLTISCQLTAAHLTTLEESSLYQHKKSMWITRNGMLRGLNSTVPHHDTFTENSDTTDHVDLLFLCSTTDAVVISSNPQTRTFTIMVGGKIASSLSAPQAQRSIHSLINPTHTGGDNYHAEFTTTAPQSSHQPHV